MYIWDPYFKLNVFVYTYCLISFVKTFVLTYCLMPTAYASANVKGLARHKNQRPSGMASRLPLTTITFGTHMWEWTLERCPESPSTWA